MAKIYLVRHGQIENPQGVIYTRMDQEIVLSEEGEQQIEKQAVKLQGHLIEAIYHSPLRRAVQTAMILETKLQTGRLVPDSRLMDTETVLQGMKITEFDEKWSGFLYHPEILAKGGESIGAVWLRMREVLIEIAGKEAGKSVAVVSHGDPIRITVLGIEGKPLTQKTLGNDRHLVEGLDYPEKGSVTVLEIKGRKMTKKDYWAAPES